MVTGRPTIFFVAIVFRVCKPANGRRAKNITRFRIDGDIERTSGIKAREVCQRDR